MQKYVKTYLDYFDYGPTDYIECEYCHLGPIIDIHHVVYRSHQGSDEIDNLIGLCRDCHDKSHFKKKPYIAKEQLQNIIKKRKMFIN